MEHEHGIIKVIILRPGRTGGCLCLKNYVVYRHTGNLSESDNGWVKELNFISWNNREPVYDIRTWNQDHTRYGKGIMITPKQMFVLKNY